MPKSVVDSQNGVKEKEKPQYKRTVLHGDTQVELRVISPSKEAIKSLGLRTKRTIISPFALNPLYIEKKIAREKADLLRSVAMMTGKTKEEWLDKNAPVDFVTDKQEKGYEQYSITCTRCGDKIATVWAKDESLKDWCDLHYICEFDKNTWYGAMAVNVSPIDQQLGFECACGEDTRDYRANKELPPIMRQLMTEYSMKHRDFALPTSAFIAVKL